MKKLLLLSLIFSFVVFAKSHASPSEKGSPGGCSVECASYDATVSADVINVDMKVSAINYLLATSDIVSVDAVSKSVTNAYDLKLELLKPNKIASLKSPGWCYSKVNSNLKTLNDCKPNAVYHAQSGMNANYCGLRS